VSDNESSLIREARPDDVPAIASLIRELARFEKAAHEAVATDEQLRAAMFGEAAHVHCHVAIVGDEVVAMALWFLNYSTWQGTAGIYLEDLFVQPEHRGEGIGRALMRTLARLCVERGYSRLQWWVLDWNTPAIDFYESIGALPMDEWTVYRLSDDALRTFAQ
jgi:GNAT superfamily N-acetyltransferase